MSLPPGFLEELRTRTSIAQVVGRKVAWDPKKSNPARGDYWAPCPFHQEKTASFHVEDGKGFFYCFGCHAKGDAVTYLRETENMSFMEAVETLANDAGMTMPASDPMAAEKAAANKGLVEAMEAAVRFYRLQLNSSHAQEARAYLERRGLKPQTLERFEIGYAPNNRTALQQHLTEKGFDQARLAEAGLIGVPDNGTPYDRFRGRIMFPIRDRQNRAIAFGARALFDGQEPKYLNSPETPLFDKGRSLYNIGPARSAAAKAGTLIVTEGYMDVIALSEAGIDHTVAPLGTAITENQLQMLWRLSPEPVVALDGDRAGLNAAMRLCDLALPLLEAGKALRFALMPEGNDPDNVVRAGGAKAMNDLIATSEPMINLIWTRETGNQVLDSPERRRALDKRLREVLSLVKDAGLRGHYETEFRARRAELFAPSRQASFKANDRRTRSGQRTGTRRPAAAGPSLALRASPLANTNSGITETRIRECAILTGCINHPQIAARFEDRLEKIEFSSTDLQEIRNALLSELDECLSQTDPVTALGLALSKRTGRNPLPELTAPGQIRANRYLGPGADPEQASRAIDEELTRHAARAGRAAEIRDAENELANARDETITYRLQQASDADHRSASRPLSESADADAEDEEGLSARLQDMIDRHNRKKPKNR